MDSGAPDSAGLEAWSLLNHSSSDREEVISTLINPSQPDTAVTPCNILNRDVYWPGPW